MRPCLHVSIATSVACCTRDRLCYWYLTVIGFRRLRWLDIWWQLNNVPQLQAIAIQKILSQKKLASRVFQHADFSCLTQVWGIALVQVEGKFSIFCTCYFFCMIFLFWRLTANNAIGFGFFSCFTWMRIELSTQLKWNWNEIETKQFWNCFISVSIQLCGQFYLSCSVNGSVDRTSAVEWRTRHSLLDATNWTRMAIASKRDSMSLAISIMRLGYLSHRGCSVHHSIPFLSFYCPPPVPLGADTSAVCECAESG